MFIFQSLSKLSFKITLCPVSGPTPTDTDIWNQCIIRIDAIFTQGDSYVRAFLKNAKIAIWYIVKAERNSIMERPPLIVNLMSWRVTNRFIDRISKSLSSKDTEIISRFCLTVLPRIKGIIFYHGQRDFLTVGKKSTPSNSDFNVCGWQTMTISFQNVADFVYSWLRYFIIPLSTNCAYMCILNTAENRKSPLR